MFGPPLLGQMSLPQMKMRGDADHRVGRVFDGSIGDARILCFFLRRRVAAYHRHLCRGVPIAFHLDVSGRLVDLAQAFDQCRLSVSARRL